MPADAVKTCLDRFYVAIFSSLGTAMIIIGALNFDRCPMEPNIPKLIILAGALFCLDIIIRALEFKHQVIIREIINIINVGLFVAGSIWLFKIYKVTPRDCDNILLYCAFVIFLYHVVLGVICIACVVLSCSGCLVLSCSGCCWVCVLCLQWMDKRQQSNSTGRTDEEAEGSLQLAPPPPTSIELVELSNPTHWEKVPHLPSLTAQPQQIIASDPDPYAETCRL
ncbi:uncharacterized protein [Aquarana catesbeiana]|uniref:uncharacterized protein isoform X2 n=1 Tax=Aquarana catesbeiana TaxID=8400 RepID=UPI003CC986AA